MWGKVCGWELRSIEVADRKHKRMRYTGTRTITKCPFSIICFSESSKQRKVLIFHKILEYLCLTRCNLVYRNYTNPIEIDSCNIANCPPFSWEETEIMGRADIQSFSWMSATQLEQTLRQNSVNFHANKL